MIRSLLFVPAKKKMLDKISTFSSDGYIIDLEDSIPDNEKKDALSDTVCFLDYYKGGKKIYVRLNKTYCISEASELIKYDVGFMLPKYENNNEYDELIKLVKDHDIIALIETPLGIVNIKDIVQNENIRALAFGAEDFTCNVNMTNDNQYLLFVKSMIVTYGKAYGKIVYDTPSFNLEDPIKFEEDVTNSLSLGFDGKLLINPRQVELINNTFASHDIYYMKKIVELFDKNGGGVVVIDGKVYEKMHIQRMKRIINEQNI